MHISFRSIPYADWINKNIDSAFDLVIGLGVGSILFIVLLSINCVGCIVIIGIFFGKSERCKRCCSNQKHNREP